MILELFDLHKKNKIIQKNTTCAYRIRKLKKLKSALVDYNDKICSALKADLNKAKLETELTEIIPTLSMINYTIKELKSWMKDEKLSTPLLFKGASSYVRYEAKGCCLVISPWNYPFQLSLYPVITSFIAGNTTILKPSEHTPHTNEVVESLLKSIFNESEVAVVNGGVDESTKLLELDFDHIFFTGSTEVGKIVMKAASKNLASVGLELGGKSPLFLDKGVEIEDVVNKISWGKLVNAGQTCVAPDYLLTFEQNIEPFVKGFNTYVSEAYPDGFGVDSDYCHIITEKHADRLEALIKDATEKGAKVLTGGKRLGPKIIEPTILSEVNKDMKIMNEEIFGPILPIVRVNDINDATEYMNREDNPLASYIFSNKQKSIDTFLDQSYSGGSTINDVLIGVANCKLPFGGAGKSGIGNYHGIEGFREFSNHRSMMNRKFEIGSSFFFPPYTESKENTLKTLFNKFSSMF